jgi:hypothetical protein
MISLPTSSVSGRPDSTEITAALAGESHRLATPEPITLPIGVEAFPSWLPCPAGAQRRWEPAPATGWLAAPACEADLRVLARIFSDHRTDLPAAGLPPSMLSDLMDQVRCDALPFAGYDSDQRTAWFGQGFPVCQRPSCGRRWLGRRRPGPGALEHFWDCAFCSYPDRSGDLRSITKISDFYSARQWHGTGMYTDYYRPLGRGGNRADAPAIA